MAANIYEAIEAGNLSRKRGKEALAHAWLLGAQTEGQKYDNKTKKAMSEYADKYASETILGLELANDKTFHEGLARNIENEWHSRYGYDPNQWDSLFDRGQWQFEDYGRGLYPENYRNFRD